MEKGNSTVKRVLAILFIAVLGAWFIKSGSYKTTESLFDYLKQDTPKAEDAITVNGIEKDFNSALWKQKDLIDFNGFMAKNIHMQGYYSNMGMYITNSGYIVSSSTVTTTDYEYEQTVAFRDFLEANGVHLLFVNEMTKYDDDSLFRNSFGVETYSNRNMDKFFSRIREAGVNNIDLRDNIHEEGINIFDLFYRTDHHWTAPAGLWATRIMADGLNKHCGYNIDLSIYDQDNYEMKKWTSCWLGEQGRKVAVTYVGLDDYTEVKPKFETSYTFKNGDGTTYEGTFDNFVNEGVYNTENNVYENGSWHYSYNRTNCINNNVESGKVLILGDSFDHVTHCFLSLGVHEVDTIILRSYDDTFSLKNFILENGYDTVIIAYAQFMVGAHDDPSSANYRMFTFEY